MKTYAKFGAIVLVVVGVLAWLALGGVSESKTYYKTISEVQKMGDQAQVKRVRVDGYVVPGSIVRNGAQVSFIMHQDPAKRAQDTTRLKVVYSGIDPLPDTFKDDAQAMADGKLGADGVFQANKIQAKCASKYEAKPQMKTDATRAGM
ncbi:MAG TPA: cytochrome c maturation protein CcmE [Bryobacteraceae bacterium]|nr:cytochrome c maturation protein CcmE [Bryobacteraceae bacterium]